MSSCEDPRPPRGNSFALQGSARYYEYMTNAAIQKRLTKLEAEVKTLRSAQKGRAKLRAMILKGLNSGPGIPITADYWKKKRAFVRRVAGRR